MRDRRGLAAAALILLGLVAVAAWLAASLLADAPPSLARGWALLRGLGGPGPAAARAARHAIEGAAAVALLCVAFALPLGWAVARLPAAAGAAARGLIAFPALSLLAAWMLGFAVQLPAADPVAAALSALSGLPLPLGRRALLVALLTPPLAAGVARVWRGLDPAALRAAALLGLSAGTSLRRLVLPELLGVLSDGAVLAFLAAAAVLALHPRPAPIDGAALGAVAAVLGAVGAVVVALWPRGGQTAER